MDAGVEQTDRGVLDVLHLSRHHRTTSMDDNDITAGGVLGTLRELFSCLLSELEGLIQFGEKLDA